MVCASCITRVEAVAGNRDSRDINVRKVLRIDQGQVARFDFMDVNRLSKPVDDPEFVALPGHVHGIGIRNCIISAGV